MCLYCFVLPQEYRKAPRKVLAHTALSDIKESIEELKYYQKSVFKPNGCKCKPRK